MKKCRFCAEMIQDEAIVCRFCGRQLDIDAPAPSSAQAMKKCPFCAEMIHEEAVVCRFCGRQLNIDTLRPSAPLPTDARSTPNLSHFPAYYREEFQRIYESQERYTGKWNSAAFVFGPVWALFKGLWLSAVVSIVAGVATAGVGLIVYWFVFGVRGNYIYYSAAVKGRQRPF